MVISLFIVACFSFVLLFGAPYLPTLKPQVGQALDLLDLEPGQTMLELGCGDGKMLVAAAKRDWHAVGYELNPMLALIAWARTRRYRGKVKVVWGNYWVAEWPPAAGIYGFILAKYMKKLDNKIIQEVKLPVKLVSLAFRIPSKTPVKQQSGLFLYNYN